ncbi:MAG: hypothetical protein Q8916_10785 [Bacteroidota bacterium]|nr:hypothetical protein [Bacteroidota bacterium]MDP4230875.1 hypothetical protein [Bacteroidota bacterium]MDP4237029.1 hypothetical protein [Bacteroidota bacterium]
MVALRQMAKTSELKQRILAAPDWVFAAIPAIAAFIIWFGSTHSGFTPDDYLVVDVQSPIRTFIDVISMFWRHDPNPQYWRPLTDATVSTDFWLWGWNGGMFHLTNVVVHTIAVVLVYYFVRRIFSLPALSACILALLFGISGSHDSNMLWIAARSDVIATIMMLAVLLTAYKAELVKERKWLWLGLSYVSYFLALSSKEVSGVVIALLPLLVYSSSPKELTKNAVQIIKRLLPYIAVTVIFLIIRLQYTIPLSQMQPLNAEGSHSITAFAKNFLYSLGYIIAPIDFRTASILINRFATTGYILAIVFFAAMIFVVKSLGGKKVLSRLYKPLILTLVTGFVSFQSFERWRVYFPSVGVLAIFVILFGLIWQRYGQNTFLKSAMIFLAVSFAAFHGEQAMQSERIWAKATAQLADLGNDMAEILDRHLLRPITIEFVTSPTKLGGAPLLQLSKLYFAKKAEADRRALPSLKEGTVTIPGDSIDFATDLDLYALDPEKGFQSLVFTRTSDKEYEVSGNADEIGLFPNAEFEGGKARRDTKLVPGQRLETFGSIVTIENAEASFASRVKIRLRDSTAVHLYFDGKKMRELE